MSFKIKSQENLWSGVMFMAFGLTAVVMAREYSLGTATRMGPGYYPRYLGIGLSILGAIITLTAFRTEGERIQPFGWRGPVMLTIGFAAFGWAIDKLGFVVALVALILCSGLARKDVRVIELILMSAVLILGSFFIFIYCLDLPFRLFWWR